MGDLAETLRMRLWWVRGAIARQIVDAVLAEPALDGASETLEEDILARLAGLDGVTDHSLVTADIAEELRARQA